MKHKHVWELYAPAQVANNSSTNQAWKDKTPSEILSDFNALIEQWTGHDAVPDSILLPWGYVRRKNPPLPGLWEQVYRWSHRLVMKRKSRRPVFARGWTR